MLTLNAHPRCTNKLMALLWVLNYVYLANIRLKQFEPVISGHGDLVYNWTANAPGSVTNQCERNNCKYPCGKYGCSVITGIFAKVHKMQNVVSQVVHRPFCRRGQTGSPRTLGLRMYLHHSTSQDRSLQFPLHLRNYLPITLTTYSELPNKRRYNPSSRMRTSYTQTWN